MLSAYTGKQVRAAEVPLLDAGLGDVLMQRAAHGLAQVAAAELAASGGVYGSTVVVLAGSGNNGGDALYAGARLQRRGAGTTAILTSDRVHADALAAFRAAGGRAEQLTDSNLDDLAARTAGADLVLDGILGTGGVGGLRDAAAELVKRTAAYGRPGRVVACDVPSGVNADTGEVSGQVLEADVTVTFGALKTGLVAGAGARAAGRVVPIDIGLNETLPTPDAYVLEPEDLRSLYAVPRPSDHKYSRGVLGIAAGSAMYPGAAVLVTGAALGTGVGMIRFLGPQAVTSLINTVHPEAVCSQDSVGESHVQAWLVGPGATEDEGQHQRAHDAIASGLPTVVDAGALPLLPETVGGNVILTPHAGELAALFERRGNSVSREAIEAAPADFARRAARETGATVLLKGSTTVVAAPSGELFCQTNATPWLATAGSGDTLAGILGALVATNADNDDVAAALGLPPSSRWGALAAAAAMLHGLAGRRAARSGPVVISDLPSYVGQVLAELIPLRDP
ncbi:NAD(P)H-hydrate epimerase [Arthrobacter sp. JZ12]|uniref:NAD(P)H-hydrate epimerase n=1 Tax=Arthrobacter sp. JZ12 TaxID=2654190 RepID=UPI002B45D041|nr:NAD(P)H-hydrate epimerase [Arthrobacter sp. JZ12]WRH25556.1 NAD(P)H-hydrate epimerase [Arthrobacter sp. JZ12]